MVSEVLRTSTVENEHNNDLSPKNARCFRSNRVIDNFFKRQLDINDKVDINIVKSFNSLVVDIGGFESLLFIENDARDYINKA